MKYPTYVNNVLVNSSKTLVSGRPGEGKKYWAGADLTGYDVVGKGQYYEVTAFSGADHGGSNPYVYLHNITKDTKTSIGNGSGKKTGYLPNDNCVYRIYVSVWTDVWYDSDWAWGGVSYYMVQKKYPIYIGEQEIKKVYIGKTQID